MAIDNFLHIYPTSRAVRQQKEQHILENAFLPAMTTIATFEQKAALYRPKRIVDKTLRALYLKEATNFKEFRYLRSDLDFIKFYTQADDFFRFYEEVIAERVSIEKLYLADTYAEFERDLSILEKLLHNYYEVLEKNNLTDTIFEKEHIRLNYGFLNSFDGFILELEGYLTQYELELFRAISKVKPFIIKLFTTEFNQKVVQNFKELGLDLPANCAVELNLSSGKVLKSTPQKLYVHTEVIEVNQRIEQIAVAMAKIEEFVQSGIEPSKIALIVPDESFASTLANYDSAGNFNFAMGRAYQDHKSYRYIEELYLALSGDGVAKEFLARCAIDIKKTLQMQAHIAVEDFFELLRTLGLPLFCEDGFLQEIEKLGLLTVYYNFRQLFMNRQFTLKQWLFLWMQTVREHTLDDIRGGKVTVMGLLESRAITFDAVVILDFNEGLVPSISNKDNFLNSSVRAHANLPTFEDRQNLQKYYYATLLARAKRSAVIYHSSSDAQPSKFIYELGLEASCIKYKAPLAILYSKESRYSEYSYKEDLIVDFNAKDFEWSASMLRVFLECKRKFYYRYIKKIKETPSAELNEGAVLHSILSQILVPKSNFKSAKELEKAFLEALEQLEFFDVALLYKKPLWAKMLQPFFRFQIEHFAQNWQIERCEHPIDGEIEGLRFKGRIDRLDSKAQTRLLIDYKSGSTDGANKKDTQKLNDFQMSIYARLLDYPANSIDFAFVKLFDGELEYLSDPAGKEAKLLEHIRYLKSLDSFKASRCEDLQQCRYCPYGLLCHRGEFM